MGAEGLPLFIATPSAGTARYIRPAAKGRAQPRKNIMNIHKYTLPIALAALAPATAGAQLINFPMEITADGQGSETVSGTRFTVNGALAPVSIDGAHGKAWRLDGYSSFAKTTIDASKLNGKSQLTFSLWVAPESWPMMRLDENGEWFTTMAGNLRINDDNTVDTQQQSTKVAMLLPCDNAADLDDDEAAALTWFKNTYGDKGTVFTPSTLTTLSPKEYNALWIQIDRVGIGQGVDHLPAGIIDSKVIANLTNYLNTGGNIFLTKHATQLITALGRIPDQYGPHLFGDGEGGQGTDIWTTNAVIGSNCDPKYDHRSHAAFAGLEVLPANDPVDMYDHESFPLEGPGFREDHNCMWDLNSYGFGTADGQNVVDAFEKKTSSTVLSTWGHVTDYCCGGIVEFQPTADCKGRVLCIGLGTYEFNQNSGTNQYQQNTEKLTKNCIDYLAAESDYASGKGFSFQLGSRGTCMFTCFSSGFQIKVKSSAKLNRYEWNHLVAVFDGTKKKVTLYNNGTEVGSSKSAATIDCTANSFYIGKSYTDVKSDVCYLNTFNGAIDDIAVYDGVRDDIVAETTDEKPVLTYSPERYADDICRPAFHGMPTACWTNETHGAVWYGGKLHLFFQKNPNGLYLSHMNWGHIVSDDLYKWEELPMAITPGDDESSWYDMKGCWSGCVYADDELTGGKPNLFYTGVDYARAMISQATPDADDLVSWSKPSNNPVINGRPDGLSDDFRDCFVFKSNGKHYMIVGSAKDGVGVATLHRYDAATATWSNDGSIFFKGQSAGRDGTFWEMPNVTQFGDKWMFTCTPLSTDNGVRTLYWVGTIADDGTFKADSPAPLTVEMDGFSKQGYGMLSPTIFNKNGKTLMLGVVPDKLGMADTYRLGYAHAYSLPREISLASDGTLVQKPYEGLKGMRTQTAYRRDGFTLTGSQSLSPVEGRAIEISGEFTVGDDDFGFTVLGTGDKQVKITCSPSGKTVRLDMNGYDRIVQDGAFGGIYESVLPTAFVKGRTAKLTVYVDHSFIDIFVNDTYAASVRIFPTNADGIKAMAFADGSVEVNKLEAYVLDVNAVTGIGNVKTSAVSVCGGNGFVGYDNVSPGSRIEVFDIAGRLIASKVATAASGKVAVQGKGVLVVRVSGGSNGGTATFKTLA